MDVRTGRPFSIPAERFTASGTLIPELGLFDHLCVGALSATYAVPLSDGAGGAYVVWIEPAAEDCDLRIQHVDSDGSPASDWPVGGRVLCAEVGTQTQPVLARASNGNIWAAWRDYRDARQSAIYVIELAASGEPVTGQPPGGTRASSSEAPASDPQLIPAAEGGVWLVWQQGAARSHRLWVRRLSPAGGLSEAHPLTNSSVDAVHPTAAACSTGALAVAWSQRNGASSELRLLRLEGNGAVAMGWSPEGRHLATTAGLLLPVSVVPVASGYFVTWSELFEDSSAARATRIELDGGSSTGWPSEGKALSSFGGASHPAACADGSGGAYLAWVGPGTADEPGGVRVLRVTSTGAAAVDWPNGGLIAATSSAGAHHPRLLPTSDGVVVSWGESEGSAEGTMLSASMANFGPLPELESLEKWPDLVRISWKTGGVLHYSTIVERLEADGDWAPIRQLAGDESGRLILEDREVAAGAVIVYRLRLVAPQQDVVLADVRVEIPALAPLALHGLTTRNGRLYMRGSVPSRTASQFELFDVQGRRLLRDVRTYEHAGDVAIDWPVPDGVRAGVFFARFSQGRESRTRRFVLGR
ncbi:MAG: hypothetical protein HZA61_10525 [Candidatus Eisenbacteria bacterium]|uniref:T9SS type A sorting domain-containing protein n=1 Tax=Eiseniibacteriota bacterium TaxID=2212470 RepID=A0A933SGG8_UNCEI|nr:hypothetical protein [Candidatus Eisenbacteria bacterium]